MCKKIRKTKSVQWRPPPLSKIHENSKKNPHKNCSQSENVTTGFEKKTDKEPPALPCIFVAHVP